MKKMIINWVLPSIMDALLGALVRLSRKTDNSIDDLLVASVINNQDKILDEIKASL